ncbi:MAG: hypothetical protein KC996_11095, partial [Phycisphaerales bacterium]|nr:hypothetical protein [Phycisphaerales bacterium]
MTATSASPAIEWLDTNESASIERLLEWLRMPSVGTDPAHNEDTARAAQWAAEHLSASGFAVELKPTGTKAKPGHPIVLAHCDGAEDYNGPHVLFYGHYDVQPAD